MELAANKALEISRRFLLNVRYRMVFFAGYVLRKSRALGRFLSHSNVRYRILFFARYVLAKSRSKALGKLLSIIENSFRHPWVAEVRLQIRFWPGLGLVKKRSFIHWDAPVAISVFRRIRGKKKPALCMSLYVARNTLYICQLQGVARTDVPRDLGVWPKRFMEACQTFAYQEEFKEIRVPRAASLHSYHYPYIRPELLPDARKRALGRIRKSLETLYDANALELGFVPDGRWFKWMNPKISARLVQTCLPVAQLLMLSG